uniref:Uncharacterized protein n=1 Tax=Myotis myotis TaxID=51298 RepID=A0A7J7S214_MYOMY|nr:hypothetical protein mMyoMyo1_010054 [Myotis myotis]
MLQTVGEDLLSYRAIPTKVTQTTRKLRDICYEEEQFPFPAPSFLGSYLLGFLYPRQTRIGCRLFPLGSVAGVGTTRGASWCPEEEGSAEFLCDSEAQPCPVQKVLVAFMAQGGWAPSSRMRPGLKNMYCLSISRTCPVEPLTLHSLHIYFIPKHQIDDQ